MNLPEAHWRIGHLCVGTSGNASCRDGDALKIKPSGIACSDAQQMARVRLIDGRHDISLKPSTDVHTHRYIYNALPDINAVIHTHSTFCTAYAGAGLPVPCILTAIADEFGGDIPISNYCSIGDDEIGKEVVRLYKSTGSRAVLIRQHGLFVVGLTLEGAVKTALMAEDCAKTAFHARQLGAGVRVSQAEIDRNHKRYSESYGQ